MQVSKHASQRMGQRGISKDVLDMVYALGFESNDKVVLNRKAAKDLLGKVDKFRGLLLKVLDKGGVTTVIKDGVLLTTYNCNR